MPSRLTRDDRAGAWSAYAGCGSLAISRAHARARARCSTFRGLEPPTPLLGSRARTYARRCGRRDGVRSPPTESSAAPTARPPALRAPLPCSGETRGPHRGPHRVARNASLAQAAWLNHEVLASRRGRECPQRDSNPSHHVVSVEPLCDQLLGPPVEVAVGSPGQGAPNGFDKRATRLATGGVVCRREHGTESEAGEHRVPITCQTPQIEGPGARLSHAVANAGTGAAMRVSASLVVSCQQTPELAARPVTPEVAGSSPVAPANDRAVAGSPLGELVRALEVAQEGLSRCRAARVALRSD